VTWMGWVRGPVGMEVLEISGRWAEVTEYEGGVKMGCTE